jgi:hypothetical protein
MAPRDNLWRHVNAMRVWVGAQKPRMLELIGREAGGWECGHLVCWWRSRVIARHGVVRAARHNATGGGQRVLQNVQSLGSRPYGFSRRAPRSAHACDRIPECTGANSELSATVRQAIKRRHRFRQHRGWAERKVGHIWQKVDLTCFGREKGDQRPCVQKRVVVRVVLDGDQVQSAGIRRQDQVRDRLDVRRFGSD